MSAIASYCLLPATVYCQVLSTASSTQGCIAMQGMHVRNLFLLASTCGGSRTIQRQGNPGLTPQSNKTCRKSSLNWLSGAALTHWCSTHMWGRTECGACTSTKSSHQQPVECTTKDWCVARQRRILDARSYSSFHLLAQTTHIACHLARLPRSHEQTRMQRFLPGRLRGGSPFGASITLHTALVL